VSLGKYVIGNFTSDDSVTVRQMLNTISCVASECPHTCVHHKYNSWRKISEIMTRHVMVVVDLLPMLGYAFFILMCMCICQVFVTVILGF